MKKTIGLLIAMGFMVMQAGMVSAATATRSFTVSATVPAATGVSINAASVAVNADGTSGAWTALAADATTMSFGTLTYNSTYGYWAPDHYFAVDIGTSGGAGNLTTVVTYSEGTNQNQSSGGHGLGYKGIATFQKVTGSGTNTQEATIAAHGKKRFIDLTGETVTPAQVSGGWLRVYLGIATDPTATGMPTGTEIFTNLDHSGQYTGTVTFTATVS